MTRALLRLCLAALLGLAASGGALAFELERVRPPNAATPKVLNANPANAANWPATFIFTSGPNGAKCTATAIGNRTILTASHCITDPTGSLKGSKLTFACGQPPPAAVALGYDIALCFASEAIPMPAKAPYERLDSSAPPQAHAELILIGFGCTTQGITGALYEGRAHAKNAEAGKPYYLAESGAVLCAGDSGGGVFTPKGAFRTIIGVAAAESGGRESRITMISDSYIQAFITGWAAAQIDPKTQKTVKADICGMPWTTSFDCRS